MPQLEPQFVLEAALLSADRPLSVRDLRRLFDDRLSAKTIRGHLQALQEHWNERGMRLVELATGWRFQTAQEAVYQLARLREERPARYSRAAMETLAIIAYRQPVTRGDIEDLRGVALNALLLRQFEERGWIETVGYRETPGRPALLGTTKQFLNDLGLKSLDELPSLDAESLPDFFDQPKENQFLDSDSDIETTLPKEMNFDKHE